MLLKVCPVGALALVLLWSASNVRPLFLFPRLLCAFRSLRMMAASPIICLLCSILKGCFTSQIISSVPAMRNWAWAQFDITVLYLFNLFVCYVLFPEGCVLFPSSRALSACVPFPEMKACFLIRSLWSQNWGGPILTFLWPPFTHARWNFFCLARSNFDLFPPLHVNSIIQLKLGFWPNCEFQHLHLNFILTFCAPIKSAPTCAFLLISIFTSHNFFVSTKFNSNSFLTAIS